MPPESPVTLIALNLEWNGSRLECEVDRYESGSDFLYVSWNATQCPDYYVPIGGGAAFAWVPLGGYEHRRYRARVFEIEDGFEWIDVAQGSSGAGGMLILTLPTSYVFVPPGGDALDPFPVDFKSTEDGRMALYWWLQPGRFAVSWHMESRQGADVEAECKRLRAAARGRQRPGASPVHLDRPPEDLKVPSGQPPINDKPPVWHLSIAELIMRDKYTTGQANFVGPGTHAQGITFNQIWNQTGGAIDLPRLSEELALLRREMKNEAEEPEHDVAVGAIAAAERSAKDGNGPEALEWLKSAGKWALSVAEKIGVGVATAALKAALGV
jgi:hypothetical protein